MPIRTPPQVNKFIESKLPLSLAEDLRAKRLIREADVECACYMHLRSYLQDDNRWNLLARRFSPHTSHYIDLILFFEDHPQVAIELKWNRINIDPKDTKSLELARTEMRVATAYWLAVSWKTRSTPKIQKIGTKPNDITKIIVDAKFSPEEEKQWFESTRMFRMRMLQGKIIPE